MTLAVPAVPVTSAEPSRGPTRGGDPYALDTDSAPLQAETQAQDKTKTRTELGEELAQAEELGRHVIASRGTGFGPPEPPSETPSASPIASIPQDHDDPMFVTK